MNGTSSHLGVPITERKMSLDKTFKSLISLKSYTWLNIAKDNLLFQQVLDCAIKKYLCPLNIPQIFYQNFYISFGLFEQPKLQCFTSLLDFLQNLQNLWGQEVQGWKATKQL